MLTGLHFVDPGNYNQLLFQFISQEGNQFEGYRTAAYPCIAGVPTIGVGFNFRDDVRRRQVLRGLGFRFDLEEFLGTPQQNARALAAELDYASRIRGAVRDNYRWFNPANNRATNAAQLRAATIRLQRALNEVMAARNADRNNYVGTVLANPGTRRPTFVFTRDTARGIDEVRDLFVNVVIPETFNPILQTALGYRMPESNERIALLCLGYQRPASIGQNRPLIRAMYLRQDRAGQIIANNDNRAEAWWEIR